MASNATPTPPQTLLNLPAYHRTSLSPYLPPHSAGIQDPSDNPKSPQNASPPSPPTQLPHLTLTYASSLDAHIALAPGLQTALSGPETKAMTHFLRSRHDAILVGANTAIIDDPGLNCRHVPSDGQLARQPVPIVLDPSGRWLPRPESKVLKLARDDSGKGVLWLVGSFADPVAMTAVRAAGGDVVFLGQGLRGAGSNGVDWGIVLAELASRGIRSVMVEGGAKVIMDLLKRENQMFVSSVVVTVAPVWLGAGGVGVSPPKGEGEGEMEVGRLEGVRWLPMGEDVVMAGRFRLDDQ